MISSMALDELYKHKRKITPVGVFATIFETTLLIDSLCYNQGARGLKYMGVYEAEGV